MRPRGSCGLTSNASRVFAIREQLVCLCRLMRPLVRFFARILRFQSAVSIVPASIRLRCQAGRHMFVLPYAASMHECARTCDATLRYAPLIDGAVGPRAGPRGPSTQSRPSPRAARVDPTSLCHPHVVMTTMCAPDSSPARPRQHDAARDTAGGAVIDDAIVVPCIGAARSWSRWWSATRRKRDARGCPG